MHTISRKCIPYIDGPLGERMLSNIPSTLIFDQSVVVSANSLSFPSDTVKHSNLSVIHRVDFRIVLL